VPRTKVYGAVRKLVERGLLEQSEDDPKIYYARSPKDVLIPLMERELGRVKQGLDALNELDIIHRSLQYVKRAKSISSTVRRYSPRSRVDAKLNELFAQSESKVVILTTAKGLIRLSRQASLLYERSRVGMRLEILSPTLDEPVFSTAVQSLREVERSNIAFVPPMVPIQLVCVDTRFLLISELKPDDTRDEGMDVGFLIESSELTEMMEDLIRVLGPVERQVVSGL
jgi:sugar-specific transcriptional regulator TrmB